jgi:hypothetical protein
MSRSERESQIRLEQTVAIGELHGNPLPPEKIQAQNADRQNPLDSWIESILACSSGADSVCW